MTTKLPATHVVIPDLQITPDTPTDHIKWIGAYLEDLLSRREGRVEVIQLGDWHDMSSLSSYDKPGSKNAEGQRIEADLIAGNKQIAVLSAYLDRADTARKKKNLPKIRRTHLRGNHEDRLFRLVRDDVKFEGVFGPKSFAWAQHGWKVVEFKEVLFIDGIAYSHFFYNPMTGRPYSGNNIELRLKTIGCSFTMGHQQLHLTGMRQTITGVQRGLVSGACLEENHRVLTSDLRYIPLKDLNAGDQIVSFDEEVAGRRSRRFKTGTVLAAKTVEKETLRVTLDNGKEFIVTPDHLWLTRIGGPSSVREGATYMWRTTEQLRKGTRVSQPLAEWEEDTSYEAGYLSGILDGEGCFYTRETTGGVVGQLSFAQKPGLVMDKTLAIVKDKFGLDGSSYSADRSADTVRFKGGLASVAMILGAIRPVRLLAKFKPEYLGRVTNKKGGDPKVVSIEPCGVKSIRMVDVDAKTMIVEGYAHHNCYLHDEDYVGPQGNDEWRGIVVCNEVKDGTTVLT